MKIIFPTLSFIKFSPEKTYSKFLLIHKIYISGKL